MHKLAIAAGDGWVPHSHPPIYTTETTAAKTRRLLAGVPGGDVAVLARLSACLAAPFHVLYVLHTPRGEGEPGRYQSPLLRASELEALLSRYAGYFRGDARFDLWVHSPASGGTLVWDRHDLLYGYGPLECYIQALREIGFWAGQPHVPAPHRHFYRKECDADAAQLLSAFSWGYSPLHAEDAQ
jgi:hypothetical protein